MFQLTFLLCVFRSAKQPQCFNLNLQSILLLSAITYRIAGKFGGWKVWRTDSFRAFGERKVGELIDQLIYYLL